MDSDNSSSSCCCSSQLLDGIVGAAEGVQGTAGRPNSPTIWVRSAGSGGTVACGAAGDTAGDVEAPNGTAGAGGGTGMAVKWLSLARRLFDWVIATAVVVGAGSKDGAEVGTQVRIPPWPDAARYVRPVLYFAFSAPGSAFQRWPGAYARRQGQAIGKALRIRAGAGARDVIG